MISRYLIRRFHTGILSSAAALVFGPALLQAVPADPYVAIPGTIVARSPVPASQFVGSPSIVILPDGSYIASHDIFGSGPVKTAIFRSIDRGVTWSARTDFPAYWSNLFVHGGVLYCMGTSAEYGNLVIRRSNDSGLTWTSPTTSTNGLLRSGQYHTAPTPMLVHGGRLWRAFEDIGAGNGWPRHFRAFLMSAPLDADLLSAASWTTTAPLTSSATWLGGDFNGWLEGNVVEAPDGRLVDFLRADVDAGKTERAALIDFGVAGTSGTFDPDGFPGENATARSGFINFPGGAKKFTVRRDPVTGDYWSLVNPVLPAWSARIPGEIRNTVALVHSPDLIHWDTRCHLLFHPDTSKHAFQYLDWQFDGDDIIATSRTSWDGNSYHNANLLTFHRFANFRTLNMANSVPTGDVTWNFPGISATGNGFEPGLLENGQPAYSNRVYSWGEVPAEFAESLITRVGGNVTANLRLRATKAGRIYVAASQVASAPILTGWTATGTWMTYSDSGKTKVYFYYRDFAMGEEYAVPQSNFNGTILVVPPASGSVGEWRCESTESGTVVPDENYTFHGKPSVPSPLSVPNGPRGNALEFAAGQHVDLGDVFPLTRTPFTIAFWLKTSPGDNTYRIPLSKLATGAYLGYAFSLNSPIGKVNFVATTVTDRLTSTTSVNDGVWHHVAVTLVPGGNMLLYIDGHEEGRRAAPVIQATTASLRFGAQTASGIPDPRFAGMLDEIQVHHTALSGGEIEAMVLDPDRTIFAGQPYTNGVTLGVPATGPGVTWRSIPGRGYDVYRSTDLLPGSWKHQSTIIPTGQEGVYPEFTQLGSAFFRVDLHR